MSALSFYLLGRCRVVCDGKTIPNSAFRTPKVLSLFKVLLTCRRHFVSKDQLLEWLWPSSEYPTADAGLRSAISRLRRALEPNIQLYRPSSI